MYMKKIIQYFNANFPLCAKGKLETDILMINLFVKFIE